MSFELFISLRYLFAKRRQTFISLITFISIAGVAVGVTALIVVLAVMNGFQKDLRERILGITSHVVIGHMEGAISDYEGILEKVREKKGVVAATPYLYTQVMITSGRGASGVVLRGLDPETASEVTSIEKNLVRGDLEALKPRSGEGSEPRPGIILGVELARQVGVGLGDWITVISPAGRLTPVGRTPKSKLFRIAGIFQSGMYEYDNTLAYARITDLQKFLGLRDVVSGIELKVADIYNADDMAEELQSSLGYPFWARDWMQMNRNLFSALKLEKVVMFVILTLIVLVAAFNIVSSLIMLVMEKTRDIAILKTMGATAASIRNIFVWEGLVIGVAGTVLGLAGGFVLCALLERYRFIELPRDVYYISTLPVQMEALDVAVIAVSAVVISLAATWYPSRQATKLDPVEALRYE
jgi:lipoprotein-releasing system permease protein